MKTRLFFCLFCLFLSACVVKKHTLYEAKPGEADFAIQAYSARANSQPSSPFRLEASLRYSGAELSSARVSALLWGNARPLYPLRLDLTAGLGTVVAKIREDETIFLAYIPQEKTATSYHKKEKSLLAFGVPIPLSLGDLTLLLTGHSGDLFLPKQKNAPSPLLLGTSDKGIEYQTKGAKIPGIIELSPTGSLLSWRENTSEGWRIVLENDQSLPLQPKKILITYPNGYNAHILVNDLILMKQPFSESQLMLPLPKGTVHHER